jgi:surface protein
MSLDMPKITGHSLINLSHTFSGCSTLFSLDLSKLDTSSVIYMDYLFEGCKFLTSVNIANFKSPQYDNKKVKTNINFIKIENNKLDQLKSPSQPTTNRKIKNEKINYAHRKDLNKEFYEKTNQPIKKNKIFLKKKDNDEKEYFHIEIKNEDVHHKEPLIDRKKLKQIFLKNGLHIYDFNDDGMNILSKDKKIEAKLRKNKKDEDFDKNYRNVIRELNKINVKVNRCGLLNETGFINKNAQKKRKGTPGKILCKNNENKDENTKLNPVFTIKRDKYILPQENKDYKNGYNYKMKVFNHNKK